MSRFTAQVYREPILPKLLKIPRDVLIIFLVAVVLIESVALSVFISQPNLLTGLGEKVSSFPNEEQNNRWRLYQNQELGFEFMYPPAVTKDSSEQPGVIARFVQLESPTGNDKPVESMLISLEISPYQSPEAAAGFIASFFQSDAIVITNEQKTIGASVPASVVTITEDGTSPAENMYSFVKLSSGEILEIRMVWTGKDLDKYEKIANQMLSTFNLLD